MPPLMARMLLLFLMMTLKWKALADGVGAAVAMRPWIAPPEIIEVVASAIWTLQELLPTLRCLVELVELTLPLVTLLMPIELL